MTKKIAGALQRVQEKFTIFKALHTAEALLSWDRESHMPKSAAPDRGQTMSTLAGLSHEMFTEKTFVKDILLLMEEKESLTPEWQRSIYLTHRELKKSLTLSKKFVEETNHIINDSQSAWLAAKQQDSFVLFESSLRKVIENRQRYAEYLDNSSDPYDVNLNDYEEGLKTSHLQRVFTDLKNGLKEMLPDILARQHHWAHPLNNRALDPSKMRGFLEDMASTIGFDMDRGAIDDVEHPFEISLSENDIRVNTRFDKDENSFTIMGLVHEIGHGLYEQNINPKYIESGLNSGVSLGIHESQSRFLENIIGKSKGFWQHFLPKLQAIFPEMSDVALEEVLGALNEVRPSLIRTEADEVTYNLHIILRFELEQDLIHGRLDVRNLPEAWRAKMQELVGIVPTTHREGELQDVHWAWANIGYFPTYALGNLNAAQLFARFSEEHPQWEDEISQGKFSSYTTWFKEHVWQHGSFFIPSEVMIKATGEDTNHTHLLKYLRKKYLA